MPQALSSYIYAKEDRAVARLLKDLDWDNARAERADIQAKALVMSMREAKMPAGQLESFLQQYSLSTDEGLALMCLAEALLRVPDKATANALIKDKVAAANWLNAAGSSKDWVVKAAGVGLLMTRKTLSSVLSHIAEPVIREAMLKAMRFMGEQFVLGQTIDDARIRGLSYRKKGARMSFDMLGEGARTAIDAEKYYDSYMNAITQVGQHTDADEVFRPGISIKLSALHPRYEYAHSEACVPALTDKLMEMVKKAIAYDIPVTVDAEEVDRLELSLEIIENILESGMLKDWNGFGLAVQAYQKRAYPLIDHLAGLSKDHKTRLQIRLVKGAYWDTEIKRAQVMGLEEYPVFTRKSNTDLSYIACSAKLFEHADRFYPMLATHNAHSVAAALELAKEAGNPDFEFQRLHGMGESLYKALLDKHDVGLCVYAPVGPHHDLLPYLVRRLLENGANTSFVNRVLDPEEPVEKVVADPVEKVRRRAEAKHPAIPLPADLYATEKPVGRCNSRGMDLTDSSRAQELLRSLKGYKHNYEATSMVGGESYKDGVPEDIKNPADESDNLGLSWSIKKSRVDDVFEISHEGFKNWSQVDADERAGVLERIADLYEQNTEELIALCVRDAGKTIPDAVDEIREAVDFCRYYANRGREDFSSDGVKLPGPTGESNRLSLHGRGTFVCISPWNFPLAIFTGQIVAALMAGNAVIAKPAAPTVLIGATAVALMHKAGVPKDALNLVLGSGREIGSALIAHPGVAGVSFTGSSEVARDINQTLAAKVGPIVPLIAETGGQNVMIVDSSALPEQVVDDVILSAFGSAGQRCSALRVLYLQDDIADKIIRMLKGAMAELRVGDPADLATDIGPVIDESSYAGLVKHRRNLEGFGKLVYEVPINADLKKQGHFFAPCAFEIESIDVLEREVFGPILHIVRYERDDLEALIEDINGTGYGLTFGIHSRIDEWQKDLAQRITAGNIYVNRSMIGAVVGVQPFGGQGLSGTGPKAGGPHYLPRFAHEKVVSIDTTAAGGNASLVSLVE